ncbi:MAG TPA: hypothetical protein VFK86_11725, partial [Bauldia sp.]|nr:hypothetical protein [Bauldia sp.]
AASAEDERVVFLAAMNIAALARERRDRAEERQALAAAFATSAGARSLGEIVHMNVAVARAEDDPASPAARSAWLRAALAWLAFEPVEAFPVAAVDVVLGTVSVPKPHIDQAISEALLAAIGGAAGDAAAANRAAGTLPAVRVSGGTAIAPDAAIGGPGVTVLCSRQRAEGQALSQPRETLLGVVWAALRELCPAAEGFGTILVDGNLGLDLPATRDQAVGLALRAGVTEVLYGDERLAIDAATRPRLAADLRVGLSPTVAAIVAAAADPGSAASGESGLIGAPGGALLVRFRRHLAATTVSGSDADLLAHIRDRGRMPLGSLAVLQGMPLAETERLLRGLEARRIVRVDVEPR